MKDRDIISKLSVLNRDELNILARKLGIIREFVSSRPVFRKLENSFYGILPKKTKIIRSIKYNPDGRRLVKNFLDTNLKLKTLDEYRLKKIARRLEIKDIPSDDKSGIIKGILDRAESKDIGRELHVKRILVIRMLFLIAGMYLFFKEYEVSKLEFVFFLKKSWDLIGGWLGGMASIAGFFPVSEKSLNWKKRIIGWWKTNRLDIISALLFWVFLIHPNRLGLLAVVAGLASIAAVFLNFVIPDWYEEHFPNVYRGIIFTLLGILVWTHFFIIAGEVHFDKGGDRSGVKVELLGVSGFQKGLCETQSQGFNSGKDRDETDKTQSSPIESQSSQSGKHNDKSQDKTFVTNTDDNTDKSLYYEALEFFGICGYKTKGNGKFVLRILPHPGLIGKKLEVKATYKKRQSKVIPIKELGGNKDIEIAIKKKLLLGSWECQKIIDETPKGRLFYLEIAPTSGDFITIKDTTKCINTKKPMPFECSPFNNDRYPFNGGKYPYKGTNMELKGECSINFVPENDGINIKGNVEAVIFSCKPIAINTEKYSRCSKSK